MSVKTGNEVSPTSQQGGITSKQLALLGDKETIVNNLSWKPDQSTSAGRIFYPYLDIKFVKARMLEVIGPANMQFRIEKEDVYAIGTMGIFVEGDWIYNSAIGTERDPRNVKDKTKSDKVKYKGNHSDAYKSCSELFGLIVPKEVKPKILPERNKIIYDVTGKKEIGHLSSSMELINSYLNNINQSVTLLAQIWMMNPDFNQDDHVRELFTELRELCQKK